MCKNYSFVKEVKSTINGVIATIGCDADHVDDAREAFNKFLEIRPYLKSHSMTMNVFNYEPGTIRIDLEPQ